MNNHNSMEQRKRSPNFSEGERELLLSILLDYLHVLENKKTNGVWLNEKRSCWRKITQEFNRKSANGDRTDLQLRNFYDNLKKAARRGVPTIKWSKAGEKFARYIISTTRLTCNTQDKRYSSLDFSDSDLHATYEKETKSMTILENMQVDVTNSQLNVTNEDLSKILKQEREGEDDVTCSDATATFDDCNISIFSKDELQEHQDDNDFDCFIKNNKKRLLEIALEKAQVELDIKKVELQIKSQELEIRKKEMELKMKQIEAQVKMLENMES